MTTVFLRALAAEDKAATLRAAIREPDAARGKQRFEVDTASFAAVPRSPFAYWVSERLRRLFKELPAIESDGRFARVTNPAGDDTRFFRAWWEPVPSSWNERVAWVPLNKGGSFAPYYFDVHLMVRWDSLVQSYFGFLGTEHRPLTKPASLEFFFRPGLTWPRRTKSNLSLRAMPAGWIFADKGPAVFVQADNSEKLLALLAIGASSSFKSLIEVQLAAADAKPGGAAHSFEVGIIQGTPVPYLTAVTEATLAALARRAWSLKRSLDTCTETSHAFTLPALLQAEGVTLAGRAAVWAERIRATDAELAAIQAEIDARCFDLYSIDEADRRIITEGFGTSGKGTTDKPDIADEADSEDDEDTTVAADAARLAAEMVSWAVGVAFGRFDVRLATGARALSIEPEPFDALPVCSPAMLTGDDGLPLAAGSVGYPLTFPADGVLVDDPGHANDLTTAGRAVFEAVFGEDAEVHWHESSSLLDSKDGDLRIWLAKSFFERHLKSHSKSRRKAPIYWQLATPSANYSVWLYCHRFTKDTFYKVLNDYVAPKLQQEERNLTNLRQEAGPNPTASQRKEIAEQEAFVEELRAFRDEIARVALLWNPDLNDGVIINFAPLWHLVPHHRQWQQECKDC